MVRIELQLDEQTAERAKSLAEASNCTIEELVRRWLERIQEGDGTADPLLGMLADEPELMDRALESAMQTRERRLSRKSGG